MLVYEDLVKRGDKPDYHTRSNIETILLPRVNRLLGFFGEWRECTSGYRSPERNEQVGGARNSLHCRGLAIDLRDRDGSFGKWCLENPDKLELCGLWMEDPRAHPDQPHVHLDCKARLKTVFWP